MAKTTTIFKVISLQLIKINEEKNEKNKSKVDVTTAKKN